jgi:hypothetical protein
MPRPLSPVPLLLVFAQHTSMQIQTDHLPGPMTNQQREPPCAAPQIEDAFILKRGYSFQGRQKIMVNIFRGNQPMVFLSLVSVNIDKMIFLHA